MNTNVTTDPLAFIGNGSGMAALIKSFNWSATSLGPANDWSIQLKSMTSFILRSNVAMTILWGTDGIMIYNDAYQEFAGQRHPGLLGSPVLEAWKEVADFNANVLKVCSPEARFLIWTNIWSCLETANRKTLG